MSFFKQTIRDVPLDNQTVLVRVDYNVPLDDDGIISDDLRIRASLPTINFLLDRHCRIVLIAHLGRPEGREASLSLAPAVERLSELLGRPVQFVDDCIGDKVVQAVKRAGKGSITLLENLRYYQEEEADDEVFARKIATSTGARYFVQDGFGVVHRAHASTHAITFFIPSVAGLLVEREYKTLTGVMEDPRRPLVAVLGGAKISDKIPFVERFVDVADKIIIGGAMANTFLAAQGVSMGKSLVEPGQEAIIRTVYEHAIKKVGKDHIDDFIVLPRDLAVAETPGESAKRRSVLVSQIGPEEHALDIGDASIEAMIDALKGAKTIVWNGTLGYAEQPEFAHGSARLALEMAQHQEAMTVVGGGDTADFVLKWDGHGGKSFDHVSTGGGASLELMEGEKLPGVESLLNARK